MIFVTTGGIILLDKNKIYFHTVLILILTQLTQRKYSGQAVAEWSGCGCGVLQDPGSSSGIFSHH